MKTPYFLINEKKLHGNLESFYLAFATQWENAKVCYSVKTNSLPWVLKYVRGNGALAEVVSDEEYQLAKCCGYSDDCIVFNGPIKGKEQFALACEGGAYVNIDSQNDLLYIQELRPKNARIGIRINVPVEIFSQEDVGYQEEGFRFGFSDENNDFNKALKIIQDNCENVSLGLHLHCNSITRSIEVYRAIAKYAVKIVKKYNLHLNFIDIGGGFFGGVPGKPTAMDYMQVVCSELEPAITSHNTTLLVEPGSAVIGAAIDLYTTVLDVKDTLHSRVVTTDGSRVYIDPLWARKKYKYSVKGNCEKHIPTQLICGYTCMDHDRIMRLQDERELSTGDIIIYHKVGAYSVTFGGMFIRKLPAVYVKTVRGDMKLVRKITTVEQYLGLHSVIEPDL